MPKYMEMYNRQKKWTLYLLSVYFLGWASASYRPVFAGLILGTSFSFIFLMQLTRHMKKFDNALSKGKKVRSLGTMSRMAMAGIAAIIAIKWPQYFNIVAVVLGLMTTYIVIMIDYIYHSFFAHNK